MEKNGVLIHRGDETSVYNKYKIIADGLGGFWFSVAEGTKLHLYHFNENGKSIGHNEQTLRGAYYIVHAIVADPSTNGEVFLGYNYTVRLSNEKYPYWVEYNYLQKFSSQGSLLNSKLIASTGKNIEEVNESFNNLIRSGYDSVFFITSGEKYLDLRPTKIIVRKFGSDLNELFETSMDISKEPLSVGRSLFSFSDGQDGLLLIWETGEKGITGAMGSDLIYQKVDKDGNISFSGFQTLVDADKQQSYPDITVDYDKNIFIVWEDERTTSKKEGEYGTDYDIYAQKIDKKGNLLWRKNGIPISNRKDKTEVSPVITTSGLTDAIIAWSEREDVYISGGSTKSDVYVQKINADGVLQWSTNSANGGIPLKPLEGNQRSPAIANDYWGGAFITWIDNAGGKTEEDIYAQQISSNGIIAQKVLYFSTKQAKKNKSFDFKKQWAKFKIIQPPFKEKYYWAQISKIKGKISNSLNFDKTYTKPYWQVKTNLDQIKSDYASAIRKKLTIVNNCKKKSRCVKKNLMRYQRELNTLKKKKNFKLKITFKYADKNLRNAGLKENNLALYYYNTKTKTWAKLSKAKQNKKKNEFTVTFSYFSSPTNYFVIGAK